MSLDPGRERENIRPLRPRDRRARRAGLLRNNLARVKEEKSHARDLNKGTRSEAAERLLAVLHPRLVNRKLARSYLDIVDIRRLFRIPFFRMQKSERERIAARDRPYGVHVKVFFVMIADWDYKV